SDRSAIEAALGPPDWADDQYLFWGDLEIGLVPKDEDLPFRNVSYFKFCLEKTGRKRFSIPGFVDVNYGIGDIDMREVMQVLVEHSIWFEHIYDLSYKDEDRGIRTLYDRRQFHFQKDNGRWLMTCYYCEQI
ncbi:MAG: hypothetical protein GY792_09245, partial [Gammaproteobacteria bacterium]|nr:hypothetical protein [Gammaproteobacteria bacterium]